MTTIPFPNKFKDSKKSPPKDFLAWVCQYWPFPLDHGYKESMYWTFSNFEKCLSFLKKLHCYTESDYTEFIQQN